MDKKFAFLVAASENYVPGVTALLNSLEYWKHKNDVLLLSYKLPETFLKKIKDSYSFNVRIFQAPEGEQTRATAIERFRIAYESGKEYDALCLLDADMYLMANLDLFFQIASHGFIITASNGMIINFNKAYQDQYETYLGKDEYPYSKIHTTAPIWLSPIDLDWFEELYKSKRRGSFDDFLFLNILGIKMGKDKRMISLSPYKVTNIHHWSIKPVVGVINKNGLILSGSEEEMLMSHGKFWDEAYYKDLFTVMKGYLHDERLGKRQEIQVLTSRNVLLQEFCKYAYKGVLSLKDFQAIPWLEKRLDKPLAPELK